MNQLVHLSQGRRTEQQFGLSFKFRRDRNVRSEKERLPTDVQIKILPLSPCTELMLHLKCLSLCIFSPKKICPDLNFSNFTALDVKLVQPIRRAAKFMFLSMTKVGLLSPFSSQFLSKSSGTSINQLVSVAKEQLNNHSKCHFHLWSLLVQVRKLMATWASKSSASSHGSFFECTFNFFFGYSLQFEVLGNFD